jgi:Holliday junction resolvase RusA-like endonuclease
MDALNSMAYRDDVQIASARVLRYWGEWPKTIIRVKELNVEEHALLKVQQEQSG